MTKVTAKKGRVNCLFCLPGSNGDFARVDITAKSIPPVSKQQTFSGIHGNCSMVVIDMTHIAVAGVVKGDEGIIA